MQLCDSSTWMVKAVRQNKGKKLVFTKTSSTVLSFPPHQGAKCTCVSRITLTARNLLSVEFLFPLVSRMIHDLYVLSTIMRANGIIFMHGHGPASWQWLASLITNLSSNSRAGIVKLLYSDTEPKYRNCSSLKKAIAKGCGMPFK